MKILWVRSKEDGAAQYRVNIPARALRARGHEIFIHQSRPTQRICNEMFLGYDAIILQKCSDAGWINLIRTLPNPPPVAYECDDLVTGLDPTNPCYKDYTSSRSKIIESISKCDAVICSTPDLSMELSEINPKCVVVPNYLDIPGGRDWDKGEFWRDKKPGQIIIGWLGGIHHVGDEYPMAEGLSKVLKDRPECTFAFCGNSNLGTYWKANIGIPNEQWIYIPGDSFEHYQKIIALFDIGVAPLQQTKFNRCKSDLRLLEYGAWGVPYVASDIAPYRRFHNQSGGIAGRLAQTPEEWVNQLSEMIYFSYTVNPESKFLRSYVRTHRGIEQCGISWENAISCIVNGEIESVSPKPDQIGRNSPCPCDSGKKYKKCCLGAFG